MSFLEPAALPLLLLLPLVVLLYLVRARYRQQHIPSLLLWRRLPSDHQAQASWRRPVWELLLVLQLLAVAVAALALARPSLPAAEARHLALVLDGSASMQATDVAPSRFEAARGFAVELIDNLGPDDMVTLVLAGARPELLASDRHRGTVLDALAAAQPVDESSDMASALALASSLAAAQPGTEPEVVAITDGAFNLDLHALPVAARFVPVGRSGSNRAIAEVTLRRPPLGGPDLSGFARLTNSDPQDAEVRFHVVADGLAVDGQTITLPGGGGAEVAFAVPDGTAQVSVSLTPADAQPVDDRVALDAPRYAHRRVVVVSEAPALWERVMRALPEVSIQVMEPASYAEPPPDAVVLLDGFVPPSLPPNELILVNPPASVHGLPPLEGTDAARVSDYDPESPLLRGLDLGPMSTLRAVQMAAPPWASVAAETDSGPLLFHGAWEGRRVVVFAFDPQPDVSNLPQLAAFPVLMANVVNWLTPGRDDEVRGGLGPGADIRPRTHQPIPALAEQQPARPPERELWPLLVALGLVLLSAEWWLYTRRGRG